MTDALLALRGLPLSSLWRYAQRQVLEFGAQVPLTDAHGKPITRAPICLVLSCNWRLWDGCEVLLASTDFLPTRRDADAYPFYGLVAHCPPLVESVVLENHFAIRLRLSSGYLLETEVIDEHAPHIGFLPGEQWRLVPDFGESDQLVVTNQGVQTVPCDELTALVASGALRRKPISQVQ